MVKRFSGTIFIKVRFKFCFFELKRGMRKSIGVLYFENSGDSHLKNNATVFSITTFTVDKNVCFQNRILNIYELNEIETSISGKLICKENKVLHEVYHL